MPTLIRSLEQKKARDPNEVIKILGAIGPDAKEAVPVLTAFLDQPELLEDESLASLQGTCVRTLGRIGPPAKPAVPALTKLLKHPDGQLRFSAARALWDIDKNTEGISTAIAILKAGREWWVKNATSGNSACPGSSLILWRQAIEWLGDIGPAAKAALPELEAALADPSHRSEAMAAIEKIDPKAAEEIKKRQPGGTISRSTGTFR